MKVELVPIERLVPTQGYSFEDVVVSNMRAMKSGWDIDKVPPITAYFYNDGVHIHDGHHRYIAAKRLGFKVVPVINRAAITTGERSALTRRINRHRAAIEHPFSVNPAHPFARLQRRKSRGMAAGGSMKR